VCRKLWKLKLFGGLAALPQCVKFTHAESLFSSWIITWLYLLLCIKNKPQTISFSLTPTSSLRSAVCTHFSSSHLVVPSCPHSVWPCGVTVCGTSLDAHCGQIRRLIIEHLQSFPFPSIFSCIWLTYRYLIIFSAAKCCPSSDAFVVIMYCRSLLLSVTWCKHFY